MKLGPLGGGTQVHVRRGNTLELKTGVSVPMCVMKKYKRIGFLVGAALLQTVYCLQSATGQDLAASKPPTSTLPASISPATAEVTRLAQSGISDEALLAFVKRSQKRFGLSAETIIYLKDLGLAPE